MRESFGSDGQPGSYADIDYTECIFMVGHNVAATQTVLWSRILDRLDGPSPPQLIVVDPRLAETGRRATLHLAPRIGTNLALLNGIQYLMFENDWINDDYVSKHVVGLEELKAVVSEYPPEKVSEITGVPIPQLEQAARILGTTKSLLSTALQGVYQSNQATASACQINNISLLRGLLGTPGSGILQMNGQPTAQNNRETGCDGEYTGFRNFQNPVHMEELARLWNIDPVQVPHWSQPTHVQNLLKYVEGGSVRMFWVSGTNPLVSLPNLPRARELLTSPGLFLVCQDIYMTETAEVADVVLPAAQWGEKTGCFTNADRTVHISHKAVEPPGECKSDLDIFLDFSRRMAFKDKDGADLIPWETPEQVFEAWKKVSAGRPCDYTGLSYERLTGGSGIQWPCNEANPNGTERLFTDGVFFTDLEHCETFGHDLETGAPYTQDQYKAMNPAGRAILKSCHFSSSMEEPDDEFPLRLSTGRKVHQFHTRTKTGRTALQKACPEPEVRISAADAERFGVKDKEMVVVRSRRGAVELRCKVGRIFEGQVFIPFHFGYFDSKDGRARAANELTVGKCNLSPTLTRVDVANNLTERWDPISKQPLFKSGSVRIERIETPSDGPHIREQQSAAVAKATLKDANSETYTETHEKRTRQLELWLGETYETTAQLLSIYDDLIPHLIHDLEVEAGLRIMVSIASDMRSRLEPVVNRLGENKQRGRHRAHVLREALFPAEDCRESPYEVLETLQGLAVYLAHIESSVGALGPVSQAMWDGDFIEAVGHAKKCLGRMQAWVGQQIKVRSPQTLLVPVKTE